MLGDPTKPPIKDKARSNPGPRLRNRDWVSKLGFGRVKRLKVLSLSMPQIVFLFIFLRISPFPFCKYFSEKNVFAFRWPGEYSISPAQTDFNHGFVLAV